MFCDNIHSAFLNANKKILGYRRRERKKWISDNTRQIIEERKAAKQSMLSGTAEQRARASEIYREKNKEVKKSARKDKRDYTYNLAREAQTAAEKGDTRTVYKITKQLTGGFINKTTAVKDKNGNVLMKEEDQLERWAEHIKEILNRPDPEVDAEIEDMGFSIEMNRVRITQGEIEKAIRQTRETEHLAKTEYQQTC